MKTRDNERIKMLDLKWNLLKIYGHKDGVALLKYKPMVRIKSHVCGQLTSDRAPRQIKETKRSLENSSWMFLGNEKNVLKLYDGKGWKTLETTQYHWITDFFKMGSFTQVRLAGPWAPGVICLCLPSAVEMSTSEPGEHFPHWTIWIVFSKGIHYYGLWFIVLKENCFYKPREEVNPRVCDR